MAIADLPWHLILPGFALVLALVIWRAVRVSQGRQAVSFDSDGGSDGHGHDGGHDGGGGHH